MADDNPEKEPILQPRIVQFARKRPKLFDIQAREEFLKNLEDNICDRRCPPNVSDRLGRNMARSTQEAIEPVFKRTLRERFTNANRGLLEKF